MIGTKLKIAILFVLILASIVLGAGAFNITSVEPVEGSINGGTLITVYGNGFEVPSDATMNLPPLINIVDPGTGQESECINVRYISEWQLKCTTPAHTASKVCVRVQLRSKGIEGSYTLCPSFEYK